MSNGPHPYPSWLPTRPDPPTLRFLDPSSPRLSDPTSPTIGARNPALRSVRIIGLEGADDRRQPTNLHPRPPQPRFRTRDVNLELLRNPSLLSHIYFHLFPILIFAHIPLQTFLDFNSVFILVQVSKFPAHPESGRNWALGVAAYVACWLVWIIIVFLVYEIIYSFVRRWRTKHPPVFPIYTLTPARKLASITSYTTFSFLLHIQYSAFISARGGSIRDGLAETFYFYSQNLPTVALLLPRAGLGLALLLAFSTPADSSAVERDSTFFNRDGTLTAYASGILKANIVWTLWRTCVLLISWIGLWILSGHACAGLCGPRYRWEEDLHEKNHPDDSLPWSWKEGTRTRIWDAYTLCATGAGRAPPQLPYPDSSGGFEGIERFMSESRVIPPVLPYPFTTKGVARVSSEDAKKVPFPPSPSKHGDQVQATETETETETEDTGGGTSSGAPSSSSARPSTSLSSLGRPIPSRYPFQPPGRSFSTASTGNSTDYSPLSQYTSSDPASPISARIRFPPPPPRSGARARAGTVPAAGTTGSSSPSPRQRARTRGGSAGRFVEVISGAYVSSPEPEDEDEESMIMEQPEPEGPQEEEEGDDVVALLSSSSRAQSPLRTTSGSGSGRHSRSGSSSGGRSLGAGSISGVRSRTQSLLQTVNSASRSSLEMVMRSRANSMRARLDDDDDNQSSGGENNTFGYPVLGDAASSRPSLQEARSDLSGDAPSESTVTRQQ